MSFYVQNAQGSFLDHLGDYVGETVTIYTTSGGQSGCGFTGVLLFCNPCFVRLITRFGTAPSCSLGSGCCKCYNVPGSFSGGYGGSNVVGSVVDIPVDKIACFVRNAV